MIATGKGPIVGGTRSSALGELLRHWRGLRGLSQLDLALEIEVSQRHLSFVESGRSIPSRKVLLTISDALDIPFRERNALLLASGYAPLYREATFDDTTMAILSSAFEQMLRNHEPHPALLMDRYWSVIRANGAGTAFFSSLTDLEAFPKPRNLLELLFDPAGIRPCVEEWETVASVLLARVRREALGQVIDPTLKALLDGLRKYPGADTLPVTTNPESPILPITVEGEGSASLISRW